MAEKNNAHTEEIAEEEIEVLSTQKNTEGITRISADKEYTSSGEDPVKKLLKHAHEFRKIKFFGPLALLLSVIGILVYPLYLSSSAVILAVLDLWKGSRLTRKISYIALFLGALSLLNTWS